MKIKNFKNTNTVLLENFKNQCVLYIYFKVMMISFKYYKIKHAHAQNIMTCVIRSGQKDIRIRQVKTYRDMYINTLLYCL